MTTSLRTRRLVGALVGLPVASSLRSMMQRNRLRSVNAALPGKRKTKNHDTQLVGYFHLARIEVFSHEK
jgi:hypothetical protein